MKHLILGLALFVVGCSDVSLPRSAVVVQRKVVQVTPTPEASVEMEALKTEYKEVWQLIKETDEEWYQVRKKMDEVAANMVLAKTAEESFDYAKEHAELSRRERILWKQWGDALEKRRKVIERIERLVK